MRKGLEKTAKEMLFQIAGSNMKQIERHVFLDEETNTLYPFNWTASTKQLDKGNFAEVFTSHRNTSNENCDILNYALNHNGPGFYFLFVFTKEGVKTYYTDLKKLLNFYFEGGRGCDDRFLFRISMKDALDNKETLSIISSSDATKKLNINQFNQKSIMVKNFTQKNNLEAVITVDPTNDNVINWRKNRATKENTDRRFLTSSTTRNLNRINSIETRIKKEGYLRPMIVKGWKHDNGVIELFDCGGRLTIVKHYYEKYRNNKQDCEIKGMFDDWIVLLLNKTVNPKTNKIYTYKDAEKEAFNSNVGSVMGWSVSDIIDYLWLEGWPNALKAVEIIDKYGFTPSLTLDIMFSQGASKQGESLQVVKNLTERTPTEQGAHFIEFFSEVRNSLNDGPIKRYLFEQHTCQAFFNFWRINKLLGVEDTFEEFIKKYFGSNRRKTFNEFKIDFKSTHQVDKCWGFYKLVIDCEESNPLAKILVDTYGKVGLGNKLGSTINQTMAYIQKKLPTIKTKKDAA